MRRLAINLLVAVTIIGPSIAARAALPRAELEEMGAKLATELARACPQSSYKDTAAFKACANALAAAEMPFAPGILWGGDQNTLRIKKRKLTHFNADLFKRTYLPLMTFTGRWTIARDELENLDVIKVESYFRNALPPGEYPYPFWHSADKWNAYETMNQLSFYVNDKGRVFAITRGAKGTDANRGEYARVQPPAHTKDQWVWTDADGKQQPEVMLFSSRYQAANPHLPRLDQVYRTFASDMRQAACLTCHNPSNPQGMEWLTLLQTPLHAAAEVDHVIKEVETGNMPQDDVGLPKDLDPALRASMLKSAQAFRNEIIAADAWEASRPARDAVAVNVGGANRTR